MATCVPERIQVATTIGTPFSVGIAPGGQLVLGLFASNILPANRRDCSSSALNGLTVADDIARGRPVCAPMLAETVTVCVDGGIVAAHARGVHRR